MIVIDDPESSSGEDNDSSSSNSDTVETINVNKEFVNISPDKHDHFNLYITEEFNVEKEIESESMIVCLSCYRSYNVFSKSTNFTLIHAQSDGFLVDCLQEFDEIDIKSVDVTNIDLFCFRMILAEVVNKFLTYKPLLLKSLYSEYCGQVSKLCNTLNISLNVDSENRTKHDIRWIFKILKSCSGSALHYWVPEGLKTGRMVNRVGTDFMRCAQSQLHGHKNSIDELQAVNKALQVKLDDFLESLQAETGLCSSYRLVASVYFANHRPAFRSSASISELYNTIELGDGLESHTALVKIIRCKCQNCKNIASCQNELPELFDELECFSDTELDACSVIDSDEGEDEVQIAPSHPSEEFQQYWDTFGFLTGGLVPDL
ncbi:unnamed protein product [Mytilus edulis]|uniref:Uncharacterized protein n=1 Tax=Mytilus edulis TaxID=6550 RepID=A0A8S3U6L0_MYTED|nr:unnamed protein product [Mytilus edulis]